MQKKRQRETTACNRRNIVAVPEGLQSCGFRKSPSLLPKRPFGPPRSAGRDQEPSNRTDYHRAAQRGDDPAKRYVRYCCSTSMKRQAPQMVASILFSRNAASCSSRRSQTRMSMTAPLLMVAAHHGRGSRECLTGAQNRTAHAAAPLATGGSPKLSELETVSSLERESIVVAAVPRWLMRNKRVDRPIEGASRRGLQAPSSYYCPYKVVVRPDDQVAPPVGRPHPPPFRPTTGTGEAMDSVTQAVPYVTLVISEMGVFKVCGWEGGSVVSCC
jgi:hypothetical protein